MNQSELDILLAGWFQAIKTFQVVSVPRGSPFCHLFLNLGRKASVCLVGTNSSVPWNKIEGQSFISHHNAHSWTKLLESTLYKYPEMFVQIQNSYWEKTEYFPWSGSCIFVMNY